jgi:hypothetical protein
VNKGLAHSRTWRAQKGGEGIAATTENIKASIQDRRSLNMPALIGRGPSMQLGGGATSCWHFDGGFIGGEQPYQQIPQGNQIPDGRRDARAHDEVDLGLSLKQWLRLRPWMGKRDDSAVTYPVNVHWAVANQLRDHLRIVYFWLRRTVRHTEISARVVLSSRNLSDSARVKSVGFVKSTMPCQGQENP